MFRMEIETSNAAFSEDPREEIAAILADVAERVGEGLGYTGGADALTGIICDVNGNRVGTWQYMPED